MINLSRKISVNHISKNDSLFFISTNNGLVVSDDDFNFTDSFSYLNSILPNNKIKKTFVLNNRLFVYNYERLYSFPVRKHKKNKQFKIKVQTPKISKTKDEVVTLQVDKDLKHLSLHFSTFNFETQV